MAPTKDVFPNDWSILTDIQTAKSLEQLCKSYSDYKITATDDGKIYVGDDIVLERIIEKHGVKYTLNGLDLDWYYNSVKRLYIACQKHLDKESFANVATRVSNQKTK